jgi:mRNA interferase RelE/StbE
VSLTRAAERALVRLPRKVIERIDGHLGALADAPRPPGCKKLEGEANLYRVRVGEYRVVYRVDDRARTVDVVAIGHRRDVYRGL